MSRTSIETLIKRRWPDNQSTALRYFADVVTITKRVLDHLQRTRTPLPLLPPRLHTHVKEWTLIDGSRISPKLLNSMLDDLQSLIEDDCYYNDMIDEYRLTDDCDRLGALLEQIREVYEDDNVAIVID